jgi:hypothetical protein
MSDRAAATQAMKGGGYYDDHSEYQRATAASAAGDIAEFVATAPLPDADRMFVIADYGSATGRNTQAADDWITFLLARAADLAPGGRLVVQMVGTDPTIAPPGAGVTGRKLMLAMAEGADELVAGGVLDRETVDRYVLSSTHAPQRRPARRSRATALLSATRSTWSSAAPTRS